MLSKDLFKEVMKMLLGVLILSFVMVVVFWIAGFFDVTVIWGALLGVATCVLNYYFLALSIQNSVSKNEGGAKGTMGISYTLRMIFIGAAVIMAIKLPCFNYLAAVIPLVFPSIIIKILNISKKGEGEA